MTMQQRPPTFEEFLAELEEERRRRQGLPPLARQPPPSPDELIQPGQFRPGEAAGMVSPVQAAQRLAAGVPAMIGGAFLPEYYKPFAAAAAETAQRLIPGQQDIERRVAAKIAMGMRPWEAAEETEKEGLGLPSTQVPLLSLLPGMGVNAPGPRLQLGLQGFLEAIAPVPFAGPVARAAGAVAAPAVKAAAPVIRRGVTEAVAAARPVVAEAARAGERYVGRAIETGGVSAGIPAPARVTAARAAAPEQLAARQARAAEVARGQAEMPVNADGTVTLFHGTSPTGAAAIRRSGTLVGKEDGVFLTTDREAARSFGGEVVEVRVNPKRLQLDDEFPSGRRDFRIPARIGEPVPVGLEPTAAELPGQAVKPVAAAAKPVAEPAPGLPILGIKGATEPVTPGAAAGVPPTEPPGPPVAPSGAAGAPKGPMPAVTSALSQAKAIVDRDAPGLVTRVLDYVPGPKQVQRGLHPSLGMSRKVLEPYVAEGNVLGTTSTQLSEVRVPVVNRLKETFGEGVVRGTEKAEIRFLGTPAQAKYPATKTLYDIAQNPHLYDLSPVQRSAIEEGDAALGRVFEQVRADYGLEIGKFPNRPGSMFLSNIEKPEAGKGIFEATVRTSTSSRAKTRFYETGRERWEHDVARGIEKPYDPVVDVEHLIGGEMHGGLSRMAGRTVYKEGLGGLNRMEALTATGHEGLVNKMVGLRKRLQTLQGELRTLNQEASQAIDDFMASPLEDTDMTALREALDIQVAPGRYVAKASPDVGKGIKLLQEEIKGVRLQIKGLQPAWKSANAKGYQFVQEGVYRYFPDADAQQIRRLAEVSNNPLLRWVDDLRATAFGGDLSPVSIQMLTAWLSDPVGVSQALAKRGVRGGMFTEQSMLVSLKADPAGWNRFTSGTGLNPLGGVDKEFSVGLIGKIPGVGKFWTDFNETVYRPVMRLTKDIFDNSYAAGIKHGLTEEQAIAVAADDATKIIPRFNPRRLGMSQAESARYRAVLTSVSFLTQPTALTIDATKAFLKMGLKQPITQSERFAVQRVSKIIAVTEALAVSTAVGYAIKEGQDPKQAALDALNSTHPNFMAITMPWGAKVGLGGPFRSLIRAVVPREVPGIPVPVPFAGIYRFGMSKMGPGLRAAYEVAPGVNRDYRGRTIRKHDSVPLDILRSIEHVVSGVAPLTTGTAYRTLRQGEGIGAAGEEALSQFAGTNYIPFDAIYAAKLRWDKDLDAYRDIPGDDRKAEAEGKPTRDAYLRANPEVDAKVFIIGERGSLQTFTARLAAARLMRENNLKVADIKGLEVQENEKFTDERVVLRRWLEANLERGQMQGQGQVEPTPVGAERGAGLMEWLGPEPVEAR